MQMIIINGETPFQEACIIIYAMVAMMYMLFSIGNNSGILRTIYAGTIEPVVDVMTLLCGLFKRTCSGISKR